VDTKAEGDRASAGFLSFYTTRRRVYGALLLFVLVAGLPVAAVPKLRNRLISRAWNLKEALIGNRAPVMVQVGQNQEPLPEEFERPATPALQSPQLPVPAKIHSTTQGGYTPRRSEVKPLPQTETAALSPSRTEEPVEPAESEAASDNEPKYRQGKTEREAYDMLISSNSDIAEIVKGNNPSFIFKTWDAAARGEDTYWVRLKLQAQGQPEADFIWQVKLQEKQISPLNYNARNIP
jgi:hypothetical protein